MHAPHRRHARRIKHAWAAAATLLFVSVTTAAAQQKPTLTPADYAKWESLGGGTLSPDGRWLTVGISRVEMDNELQIHDLRTGEKRIVANATNASFSSDSRWLAYSIGFGQAERERIERARQPLQSKVAIVDLRTGAEQVVENIASFSFSGDAAFIALRGYAPRGERRARGVDVMVRDLGRGVDTYFGNIAEHSWQDQGSLLALVVDAENRAGNGVQLFEPRTGSLRTLDSDTVAYGGLTWRRDSDDLALRKERRDSTRADETHIIMAWTGLAGRSPQMRVFDPTTRVDFPADTRIVSYRSLDWSDDGRTLFFGLRDWELKPASPARSAGANGNAGGTNDDKPNVEIWHARDVDIIPEQRVRANQNQRRNALAAWHLQGDRLVELTRDQAENVSLSRNSRVAVVLDGQPYDTERMFGPARSDVYVVDVATGQRTQVQQRVQWQYGASPGGRYTVYHKDGDFWVYDISRGTHTNVTRDVPTSFVNLENDHTITDKPPYGFGGWTPDDGSMLLFDRYDIWQLRPDGSRATRLTNGAADQVRYRLVRLDFDDPTVDLTKPNYLFLYGERSKQYGYGRLHRGTVEHLVLEDRNIGRLARARDADVFAFVKQSFHESPNYFAGGPGLRDARRVTDTNAFQADYAWSPRSELIDFTNDRGEPLQAALHYPANYQPGRQYPMIVYYYEITSNTIHSYNTPSERAGYSPTVWTQEGYFVLRPDITYRDRNPGISAAESVIPAVDAVIARGAVDPRRVGITGHSWGGYQTTFLATVSDRFAAAVAGAPLTEMYSMYLSIYWNTGGTDARIFEISQGRMEVPPWQDPDSYLANSPVHQIENMTTPLLVAFGDKDGAVDWQQGIVMYNAARRAGKDFVLLVYPGENHSLARKPNQIDYHRRSLEWFGHYLKGEPAPAWMTEGVRHGVEDVRPQRGAPAATTTTTTTTSGEAGGR
jgi:dipeptidyl aminopeptidase/acylaminoacyl peptidase